MTIYESVPFEGHFWTVRSAYGLNDLQKQVVLGAENSDIPAYRKNILTSDVPEGLLKVMPKEFPMDVMFDSVFVAQKCPEEPIDFVKLQQIGRGMLRQEVCLTCSDSTIQSSGFIAVSANFAMAGGM